jgi:hypothetical protein
MNDARWNTFRCDPRNMIGDSIISGRDSLHRNRAIECVRVGNDTVSHVELTRYVAPVWLHVHDGGRIS